MVPSLSPIWASKPASERARARSAASRAARPLTLAGLALLTGACRGEYRLPPTACDDYCHAVERADCSDDYPADCVRDCEKSRSQSSCDAQWQTLDNCYAAAEDSAFVCVNDRSQPAKVCLPERRALSECMSAGSGPCFDECLRQVDSCGATLSDCEAGCHDAGPGCAGASHDYYACLQDYPPDCRAWGQPDPRPVEQIPCFYEALGVLACGK